MSTGEIVTLSAAVISLLGSILALAISTTLATRKERRQLLWSKELDRFFALEELAGSLVEQMELYSPKIDDAGFLSQRLKELEVTAGKLARYPKVRQSVRDLNNALYRVHAVKREHGDWRAVVAESDIAFRNLLDACDKVTERNAEGTVWHRLTRREKKGFVTS